jgi:hypothetical protein
MSSTKKLTVLGLIIALGIALSACSVNVERNEDGSLTVESSMTEASLQQEIEAALDDPLLQDLTVDLRDGYIQVTGERENSTATGTDQVSFRLDLDASDGHLMAKISEAVLNDEPIDQARVDRWNERIAKALERKGRRRPNSTLESVSIGGDTLDMVWRVETRRSRAD